MTDKRSDSERVSGGQRCRPRRRPTTSYAEWGADEFRRQRPYRTIPAETASYPHGTCTCT